MTLPDIKSCYPISVNNVKDKRTGEYTRQRNDFLGTSKYPGVAILLNAQFNSQNMPRLDPPVKVSIVYTFPGPPRRDTGNYNGGGSTKWLIDWCKGRYWNGDDKVKDMDGPHVIIVEGAPSTTTTIIIEEK